MFKYISGLILFYLLIGLPGCSDVETYNSDLQEIKWDEYRFSNFSTKPLDEEKYQFRIFVDFVHVSGPPARYMIIEKDDFNNYEDGKPIDTVGRWLRQMENIRNHNVEDYSLSDDDHYYVIVEHQAKNPQAKPIKYKLSYKIQKVKKKKK